MTEQEIDAMPAGPDMDWEVTKHLIPDIEKNDYIKKHSGCIPAYSHDYGHTISTVTDLNGGRVWFQLTYHRDKSVGFEIIFDDSKKSFWGTAGDAQIALAACRAILKTPKVTK